jgi:hypothetical protein
MRRPERIRIADRSLATVEQVAAELDRRLPTFESRRGVFTVGEATSRYTAFFDAGELRHIEELLHLGEYGSSRIRYYFNNRALFLYLERAERSGMGGLGTSAEVTERAFAYDSIGQLSESRKTINGRPAPIEDYELMSVRNHTAELKRELSK